MVNSQKYFFPKTIVITALKLLPLLLALLFVLFLYRSNLLAESAYNGCGGDIVSASSVTNEGRIIELVNEQRAAQGLPPMKLNDALTNAARYHATDMSQDDYFNHQTNDRSNGSLIKICNWADRLKVYFPIYNALAENIAWGYSSPEKVMEGWMNSPGHRANILGSYREIGVGYYNDYWVQDFGSIDNSYPVIINREAQATNSPEVTLYIYGNWQQMRLRNDDGSWGEWQQFQQELAWSLSNISGSRRVDVELKDSATTVTSSDTIVLAASAPEATPIPTPTVVFDPKFFVYLATVQR